MYITRMNEHDDKIKGVFFDNIDFLFSFFFSSVYARE